jgi:two-component system, OmpR family, sensor histidine kinase KdpD
MAVKSPPRALLPDDPGGRLHAPAALRRLTAKGQARRIGGYSVAILGTLLMTAALLQFRDQITPLSKGFGFLVVVVSAAAVGGLGPGIGASILCFLTFNYFFLPPYNTFVIGRAEDVVVLFVFLGLSLLVSVLLARATDRAEAAEARESELRLLQDLSSDLVAAVPGPRAYQSMVSRLVTAFGFSAGGLFVLDPATRDLLERATVGVEPGTLTPRWDPASDLQPPERLPLSVGGRNLGLLVLTGPRPPLAPAESRVIRAFSDQFALVLERDRLLRTATDAEIYRQSDQVRRSLLAAVSHDLRTPLAAIKASVTDLLGEDAAHRPEQLREALESINGETERLASLVANLLDMSRIEGGMLKPRVQAVDLQEVLATATDRLKRQRPRLRVRVRAPEAVVRADPVFLDRVVTNLLDNAGQASVDGGSEQIEVESRRDGDRVTIRVIDHGRGVPQSVREQLFYPFYQLKERHPRLGTGLGLALAKGFLGVMDGEIWIEETPGGGATFAISLPADAGPGA